MLYLFDKQALKDFLYGDIENRTEYQWLSRCRHHIKINLELKEKDSGKTLRGQNGRKKI
jgi:hypothetical protein